MEEFEEVPLYECDPDRNLTCDHNNCKLDGGPCSSTFNPFFAQLKDGEPIIKQIMKFPREGKR